MQFLLTEGRQEVEQVVRNGLQEVLDSYESGILIQSVQLQSVEPPSQVIDAFDEVQRARQDKERLVNEANSYLNKICLLYTSPSPRDPKTSRMPSSA